MISVSQGTLKRIREHLFRKVQKLPVRYFDTNPTGDIMSRFTNDVDIIGEMLNSTLVQIFSGTITLKFCIKSSCDEKEVCFRNFSNMLLINRTLI